MRFSNHGGLRAAAACICCHKPKISCSGNGLRFRCGLERQVTLDIPQGEIAATNFYDLYRSLGEKLGEELGEMLDEILNEIFMLHLLCRTAHQNFFPNSFQFIIPCLVTTPEAEISKFHLRELPGLGAPNGG